MKGYVLDVVCADCGRHSWNEFLTMRFPLKNFKDSEVIDLLACDCCCEGRPQYIVKYDRIWQEHDRVQDDLYFFKKDYDVHAHFPAELISQVDELEYAEIHVSAEKISRQEVERRELFRKLKRLDDGFEDYYEPPFGSDDELGPKTITANIMEVLDEGRCEVDFDTEGETLLEELVEEMDEFREVYLLEYGKTNPELSFPRYFVISQLSYYGAKNPRFAVVEFSQRFMTVDTYVTDDKAKLLEYLKASRYGINGKPQNNIKQLPWSKENVDMLRGILVASR